MHIAIEYPKWIYHKTEPAKIVQSKEEHEAQGTGWKETPAAFDKKSDETSGESKADQNEKDKKNSGIKEIDFVSMTVAQLKESLIKKGHDQGDFKGMKKDELIVLIGSV